MGELHVTNTVVAKDSFGLFIDKIKAANFQVVEETVRDGTELAKAFAPYKTGALEGSITPVVFSDTQGAWAVGTDHWRYQEEGTAPHGIDGDVSFFWEREGRWWSPGDNTILHPGNPAIHFMRRSFKIAGQRMLERARRLYPG